MEEILIYLSSAHRLDGRIGSYIVCIGSYIGIVNILLLPTIKQWQLHQLFHSIYFKWYQTLLHLQVVTLNLLHFCLTPFHCTSRHYYEIHSLLSTASSFTTIEPFLTVRYCCKHCEEIPDTHPLPFPHSPLAFKRW